MSNELRKIEYELSILNEQIRYLNNVKKIIIATVDNKIAKTMHLISNKKSQYFVICGASGSGKTRSIEMVNRRLSADDSFDEILECRDFCICDDVEKIERAMQRDADHYGGHNYIAYSIMGREMGQLLAKRNQDLPVIFINH